MGIVEQPERGNGSQQSSQEIASPFSGPIICWIYGLAPLSYQADTGTNHYKQQRKLDGEKTQTSLRHLAASQANYSYVTSLDKSIFVNNRNEIQIKIFLVLSKYQIRHGGCHMQLEEVAKALKELRSPDPFVHI